MWHRVKKIKLGRDQAERKALLLSLSKELFDKGSLVTTIEKAKFAKPQIEKYITRAKKNDLSARRELLKDLRDKAVVSNLLDNVGAAFKSRNGGYTRIQRLKRRVGDNALLVRFSLVDKVVKADKSKPKETEPKVKEAKIVKAEKPKTKSKSK